MDKDGELHEVCYDSAMVPIDDINAEEIGGWRVKVSDFNKTIINMNITRSHESLVVLLPLGFEVTHLTSTKNVELRRPYM